MLLTFSMVLLHWWCQIDARLVHVWRISKPNPFVSELLKTLLCSLRATQCLLIKRIFTLKQKRWVWTFCNMCFVFFAINLTKNESTPLLLKKKASPRSTIDESINHIILPGGNNKVSTFFFLIGHGIGSCKTKLEWTRYGKALRALPAGGLWPQQAALAVYKTRSLGENQLVAAADHS